MRLAISDTMRSMASTEFPGGAVILTRRVPPSWGATKSWPTCPYSHTPQPATPTQARITRNRKRRHWCTTQA